METMATESAKTGIIHEDDVLKRHEEAWHRWEKFRIDQLGYTANLLLGLAIGALGYCVSLLKDGNFASASFMAKSAWVVSFISFAISGMAGLLCAYNRLRGFRAAAQRAHKRARRNESIDAPTRAEGQKLDAITWNLLRCQIVSLFLGISTLVVSIFMTYGKNLRA